jgi:hypothetical protein
MLQSDANLRRTWRDQRHGFLSSTLGSNRTTHPVEHAVNSLEMQTPAPTSESHHDLYIRAGNAGFYFRNDNRGVTLTGERINWILDGSVDGAPYTNIRSVHLQSGADWRNPTNICRITFADGHVLLVTDADHLGEPDPQRRPVYRNFIHDLHARLAAPPQASISFTSGYQGFRYPLIIACSVLLGLVCVVGPIVAMVMSRSLWPVFMLAGGIGLYWPLVRTIEKNAPRSYDPQHPPQEQLEE